MKKLGIYNVSLFRDFVEKHKKIIIICFFTAALFLRLFYFIEMQHTPYGNFLYLESAFNDMWAREIAEGNFNQGEIMFSAPLYPYLLGLVYFLTNNNSVIMKVFQFFMGLSSCWLVFLISCRIIDQRAAYIALGLSLFYSMFIYFENELLAVPLIILLNLGAVCFLLTALEKRKARYWIISGFVFGLAEIAGSSVVVFLLLIGAWLFIKFGKKKTLQQTVKYFIFLLAGFMVPILPVTLHNAVHGKAFVPVSIQKGFLFYSGNHSNADGYNALLPWKKINLPEEYLNLAERGKMALNKSDATDVELSSYWLGQGLVFLTAKPSQAVALYAKKAYLFWNSEEIGNNRDIAFTTRHSLVLNIFSLPFFIVFLLAIGGIVIAFFQKKELFIIYIFILSVFLSALPFVSNAQSRIPMLPFLIIPAAYFISQGLCLKKILLDKKINKWIFFILIVISGLFIYPFTKTKEAGKNWFLEAKAYEEQKNISQAAESLKKSLEYNPENSAIFLKLSQYYLGNLKNPEKSIYYLEQVLEKEPKNVMAYYQLGLSYKVLKQINEAKYFFQTTVSMAGKDIFLPKNKQYITEAYLQLGQIEEDRINYDEAMNYYKEIIKINPDHKKANFYLGRIYYSMGFFQEARRILEKVLRLDSGNNEALALMESIKGFTNEQAAVN
ncbi:MAG: tetratricopeptide repeat protein [Spirochaetales bacterium]|nr:tetratricopeptide repeat protein [Spirochaetales bacterium]